MGARQHRGGQRRLQGDAARERGAAANIPVAPAPTGAARPAPFVSHVLVSSRPDGATKFVESRFRFSLEAEFHWVGVFSPPADGSCSAVLSTSAVVFSFEGSGGAGVFA